MILVLLGTQNNSFIRLVEAIQKNVNNNVIKHEVIIQAGFTKFESDNIKVFKLIDKNELSKLQDRADIIITHGGVGSIISSLKKGKKVIVAPRLKKYGEHVNNHQLQIARRFEQEGYVKTVINMKNLGKIINSMEKFIPQKYESDESNIISIVENYIDNN